MKSSVLWGVGVVVVLMAFGLAVKWTEPISEPSLDATPSPGTEIPLQQTPNPTTEQITVDGKTYFVTHTLTQTDTYARDVVMITDSAAKKPTTLAMVTRSGDVVTISRGGTALVAEYNRVTPEDTATSITFTDDSTTELTVSGEWTVPDITLDVAKTIPLTNAFVFQVNGDAAGSEPNVYLYDAGGKERLSLLSPE